jgi:hypothetical protein
MTNTKKNIAAPYLFVGTPGRRAIGLPLLHVGNHNIVVLNSMGFMACMLLGVGEVVISVIPVVSLVIAIGEGSSWERSSCGNRRRTRVSAQRILMLQSTVNLDVAREASTFRAFGGLQVSVIISRIFQLTRLARVWNFIGFIVVQTVI